MHSLISASTVEKKAALGKYIVLVTSNSLKPVFRPSVCPFVRPNHLWAQRAFEPSAGAKKKPPVRGLNFLVIIYSVFKETNLNIKC